METKTENKPAVEMVTVTVNGVEKQYPKGKNLLAALLEDKIQVPHYCWHPSLSVAGNCRLCMVEIEGAPRPSISCNMSCTDGLKIQTESELVHDAREGMMEFLLQNHPLDCPVCDRGGECMLQRYSMQHGMGTARTIDDRRRFVKPQFDPLIDIERNRCIMCTRCVRFMDEVGGEHVMGVFGHGDRNYIGTEGNGPVSNIFSGNVIDICPVGCLTSKPFRFQARPWELQQVTSTCTLCSAGCPTTAWVRDGEVYRVTPPVRQYNNGFTIDEDTTQFICNEGRFGNYYANSSDRLLSPLRAEKDSQVISTWDDCLERARAALSEAAQKGPDKVAVLAGARCTNEEFYLLSRMARAALGTNQIDARLDFVTAEASRAASTALAASNGDLERLERREYEATLVIDAHLFEGIPVTGLRIREAARRGWTRLGILNGRHDGWLTPEAHAAPVVAPEDLPRVLGELKSLIGAPAPDGEGSDESPAAAMRKAIGEAKSGLIVLGLDTAGGTLAPQIVPAALELLAELGPDWDFLPVFHGRNIKGAFACGAFGDRLPMGAVGDEAARSTARELWGELKAGAEAGGSAIEILERAAAGEIETLFLHRCDELSTHPRRSLIEAALGRTPSVIAVDVFPSWVTDRASVVLPGAVFFETGGSLTAADGTVAAIHAANRPPGEAQEDWKILVVLSEMLGLPLTYDEPADLLKDLLRIWDAPPRTRYDDLRPEGPGEESPQRPQPNIIRKRKRPQIKLHFSRNGATAESAAQTEAGSNGGGTSAAEGGIRLLWFQAVQGADHLGSRAVEFAELRPDATIELNPADIARLGVSVGSFVRVSGCENVVAVEANKSLPEGLAFAAHNVLDLRLAEAPAGLPVVTISTAEVEAS